MSPRSRFIALSWIAGPTYGYRAVALPHSFQVSVYADAEELISEQRRGDVGWRGCPDARVRDALEIRVLEETATTLHLVLPARAD
jgi:hypothetical protein